MKYHRSLSLFLFLTGGIFSHLVNAVYALPQQSITLAEFGDVETAGAVNVGGPGLATEFLSLKGATGGDQTTFEYVEVDTFGGSTTTFTGKCLPIMHFFT